MTTQRTPLLVIGGFLGAGKTSLLNHLLSESGGQRWLALVNDFGAINIDTALVAQQSADTVELTNGCVCCSMGDDLSQALIQALDRRPAPDAIVIEASGVSDPWRIAQIGLAAPDLALDGVVVVVDAGAVLKHASDPLLADSLVRQLGHADLIVVNKTDQIDEPALAAVHAWLDNHAPQVRRWNTTHGRVPIAMVNGAALLATHSQAVPACGHCHEEGRCDHHDDHLAHNEIFATWAAHPEHVYDLNDLRSRLSNLPTSVLRVKGFVQTQQRGWIELQYAGSRVDMRTPLQTPTTAVVVGIGRQPNDWTQALGHCFNA